MLSSGSAPLPITIGGLATDGGPDNRVLIPPVAGMPEQPPGQQIISLDGETMGTRWQVHVVMPPATGIPQLRAAIEAELTRVIALFSPWVADSEICRFNNAQSGPVVLSGDFFALLETALEYSRILDGTVDPTLGALVDLWGFGPPGPRPVYDPLPSSQDIAQALACSGWQHLKPDAQTRTAYQPGGLKLDFSGIAKGHAVDRVSQALTALGATSHLVEIGGELVGRGVQPDAQPWWVDVETVPGISAPRTLCALFDLAVATSGDWRKTFSHDGRAYSHTIDPATGQPLNNGVAQVTVFADTAMRADILATALGVMGPDKGPQHAMDEGLCAHFVVRGQDGFYETYTPAYATMMDDGDDGAPVAA